MGNTNIHELGSGARYPLALERLSHVQEGDWDQGLKLKDIIITKKEIETSIKLARAKYNINYVIYTSFLRYIFINSLSLQLQQPPQQQQLQHNNSI